MNCKNFFRTFSLAFVIFLCITQNVGAQWLDFYSKIDDAGDSLAQNLTKRHLEDFGSFRDFGIGCRDDKNPWFDAQQVDQQLLEDLLQDKTQRLMDIRNKSTGGAQLSNTDAFNALVSCLKKTYIEMKQRSAREQTALEVASAIGIFMDGNTENSDFDIVTDIEKIDRIIFKNPPVYNGKTNNANKFLKDFLSGKKPKELAGAQNIDPHNVNSSSLNNTNTGGGAPGQTGTGATASGATQTYTTINTGLPWQDTCRVNTGTTDVDNLVNADFLDDLNAALLGGNARINGSSTSVGGHSTGQNTGVDYSQGIINSGDGNVNHNNSSDEKKDFANKLPCNGIFCITIGTNIKNQKLLSGGVGDNSIEGILDKHIQKTEKVSWSDLSAQKMTNNSFQLPFLNIKFSDKVAGARVYMHNSPQVTKTFPEDNAEEKQRQQFEADYRCALIAAGLDTEELKNGSEDGGGFAPRPGANTETKLNSIIPTNAQDETKFVSDSDCQSVRQEQIRQESSKGFSTQINEISAFTKAMLSVINQILDAEKRLDSVPTR